MWVTLWGEAGGLCLFAACGRCGGGSPGSRFRSCRCFGLAMGAGAVPMGAVAMLGTGGRRGQVEGCREVAVASASAVQALVTCPLDFGGLWGHRAGQEPHHPAPGEGSPCGAKHVAPQLAIVRQSVLLGGDSSGQCPLGGCWPLALRGASASRRVPS